MLNTTETKGLIPLQIKHHFVLLHKLLKSNIGIDRNIGRWISRNIDRNFNINGNFCKGLKNSIN